ncbi:5-hydroxytryptamine receptor 2A-like [Sitodiplosis mosellana]|uniref:5-hydroxytryptamine receptor 2A-like n=1 Tax=Sitodiplosis mosellana TaxID=263140 RepID=UPI002443F484|nr:5-hydroxytryptamine receptor 2A-like [Sitodiplosis mosellana]XP_055310025.1 5-hydroxytryptamine receptor 2A-like [Sitodiplosis mosellana]XP_055310026.1 5-hydroxytryptamine receptor 2A-like [Sitodiplosis mosellana]XP_055310027.1 5-hydroxytryptamine receptor 2A-like [Sitodiplosis mosellana]XP_055310028.1 5-hydroxytryptamine receptor 2A-like [Sitodiplosis mosellana]XP_055310029.1 5-hydroxytryptamine receptor 2A-like [Sitodiplosis mosellana]XP_055310030.1 5-hydroxytryptamine receptor 2A-like [
MEYLESSMKPSSSSIDSDLAAVVKDAYDIFIDGGNSETYLSPDFKILNNSFYFNGSYDGNLNNTSILTQSNIIHKNTSEIVNNTTGEDFTKLVIMAVTSIILGLVILITVIGNVFVIAAIILERNLQNVANYLVASLAVADLFVACLVMPLGAVYEISEGWILGPELCDIWTSCDVLCCTASILHLVAIAADRYWAVTNVDYIHSRTTGRVSLMIFFVWISAVIVSLAPQFGWKDPEYMERIEQQKCMVSQDIGYQIFATCSTFYVPLLIILILYWKIYQTARKRIHRRRPKQILSANNNQVNKTMKKSNPRLRFRLTSNFANHEKSAVSSLGLVEGNSTITVNTVGDTDESSTDKKGIDIVTTTFNDTTKEVTTSPSSEAIVTVSQQVTNQKSQPLMQQMEPQIQLQTELDARKEGQSKEVECGLTINDPSIGNVNANPLLVSSSPSHPNHQKHDEIQKTPPSALGTTHQQSQLKSSKSRKETIETKRERKAAKTLAIITGAFVVCWLPFFLMALVLPLCGETCSLNDKVASLFLWLGYFNSTLNPVIYTIFSPEFRQAFKRILFGSHRTGYYRGGKL